MDIDATLEQMMTEMLSLKEQTITEMLSLKEQMMTEMLSLKEQVHELKMFQQTQQESIASLIALSQQQTSVIQQQNSTLQRVVLNGSNKSIM